MYLFINIPNRRFSQTESHLKLTLYIQQPLIQFILIHKSIPFHPQVKRLAMGLLRTTEESRPLVHNKSSPNSGSTQTICDGYVNEGICDPEKLISSKFGDSCRKSLTSVLDKGYKGSCEFDMKKHFLRETSSGEYFLFFIYYSEYTE